MNLVPLALSFLLLAGLSGTSARAAVTQARIDERLWHVLSAAPAEQAVPVIIHLAERTDLRDTARLDRKARRSQMVRRLRSTAERVQLDLRRELTERGISRQRLLWAVNALAVDVPAGMVAELAARPDVAGISLDATVFVPRSSSASAPVEANIDMVGAPTLWVRGVAGANVVVATVDTGADLQHAELQPRWRGGANSWYDPNGEHPATPHDHDGHGTGVLGVLVGGSGGGTAIGVAPDAQWIAVKIFNDAGEASFSNIYLGYQWLLDPDGDPDTDDLPDVINSSWALDGSAGQCVPVAEGFQELLQLLKTAEIALIFSAGNAGPDANSSASPANYPEVLAVGSIGTATSATAVSDFSARGPSACDDSIYPEVVAPGYQILTADLTAGGLFPNASTVVTGTSFAAPAVAGVMALLRGAFPTVSLAVLEEVLLRTAEDLDEPGPDVATGYGLISAPRAFAVLNALPSLLGAYEAGQWYFDASGNGVWDGAGGGDRQAYFGTEAMTPVTGDWNGDGVIELGAFEAGQWYLDVNGNGSWDGSEDGDRQVTFGTAAMLPVTGDWDGDGVFELGAFEAGQWYLDVNGNGIWDGPEDGDRQVTFGTAAMLPVVGDWNGDGAFEVGAYEAGQWYLDANGNGVWDGTTDGDRLAIFGTAAMVPVTGDWNGDGDLDLGAYEAGQWYLDANGNGVWDGTTDGDLLRSFGTEAMRPVVTR